MHEFLRHAVQHDNQLKQENNYHDYKNGKNEIFYHILDNNIVAMSN